MSNISTYKAQSDIVRMRSMNTYIEARGNNGKLIVCAFVFMLICIGVAALKKAV